MCLRRNVTSADTIVQAWSILFVKTLIKNFLVRLVSHSCPINIFFYISTYVWSLFRISEVGLGLLAEGIKKIRFSIKRIYSTVFNIIYQLKYIDAKLLLGMYTALWVKPPVPM